jgi:Mg-chelatase subunit ChlD
MGGGGKGLAAAGVDRRGDRRPRRPPPPGTTGYTEDVGAEASAEGEERPAVDATVVAAARAIAARLAVARPRERLSRSRGAGELRSVRYTGAADEIDFDRTFDAIAERRPLGRDDVVVRERRRRRRAIVLAVDVSGSMRGERIRTAAATVGALTAELAHDDLAVVAFWSDAAVLLRLGEQATLEQLVDQLLAIEPIGLTNVTFPLEFAERELRRMGDRRQRVLLLSDCVHNAGPDPRSIAARLPRLDVLLDASGEQDPDLARDLARHGRGIVQTIRDHRDVAPALSRILDSTND